jgi:hypothetical protein
VDMGRSVNLDELRIHVRNATGQLVPFGGPVTWTVWASQDGTRWAPIAGVSQTFSVAMSAYVLGFATTAARYFKAVSFGVNTIDTFVTEVQPFVRETLVAGETLVAHAVRQGLGLDLSAVIAPKTTLTYAGQVHANSVTAFNGKARLSSDVLNAGNIKVGPFGAYTFDAGASQLDTRAPGSVSESRLATTGGATIRPIERFSARIEARRSLDRVGGVRSTTNGATLSSTAIVYDALVAGASIGMSRQSAAGGYSEFLTGNGNVVAQVRQEVELRLDVAVQRSVNESGDVQAALASAPVLQTVTFQRYSADIRFRPAIQLDLLGRVGYASTASGSGVIRKARAAWEPFPGGNIRLAFDYDVEVDPLTGRSYRQISAQPQWLVNGHATLALRYNDVRGSGGGAVRQQSINLSLSIVL